MAAVLNKRDVALQAASPRTVTVNLGSTVNVNGTVSGNVTGTLGGTSVTTVVNAALNATANYFTTSTSDPTGGANGDAHFNSSTNVMWFKVAGTWTRGGTVSASEITTGTLAAARIAANSITASKINVSSLSSVSANLGTVTAGDIISSANINITGQATFGGNITSDFTTWAAVCNPSSASTGGIIGWAGSAGAGVRGNCVSSLSSSRGVEGIAGRGTGVYGVASTGTGVKAQATGSGTALAVLGPMTITSNALVSNLRAATCQLADNSTKFANYADGGSSTGTSTATFVSTNKPGSNSSNVWWSLTNGSTTIRIPIWLT